VGGPSSRAWSRTFSSSAGRAVQKTSITRLIGTRTRNGRLSGGMLAQLASSASSDMDEPFRRR
jgi:hypothetical protein